MAKYLENSNPFLEGDDEEDDGFVVYSGNKSHSNQSYGGGQYSNRRNQQKQELIYASEDRQLESSRRALSSLYDSERMGVATAEELLRQGEQLDNIERKTTQIDQSMTTSQKHINNIKSVFGGIKNWWTGRKKEPEETIPETRESKLKETVEKQTSESAGQHPALKLRSEDYKGFYEDDDLDDRFMAGSRKTNTQQFVKPVTNSHKEELLNQNLVDMSSGISRLKDLAIGLGDEIEKQNDQIDRINPNMDRLNERLEGQNKQMKGILRK